jgi:hypothetical protein
MTLSDDQQVQVDIQIAVENARHANQLVIQAKQAKLEAVRLAQQTLIENSRSKAVDSRDVAATDITAYASTLTAYIDA